MAKGLLKNWDAEGVASEVNDYSAYHLRPNQTLSVE
jgi:hypothetical protein